MEITLDPVCWKMQFLSCQCNVLKITGLNFTFSIDAFWMNASIFGIKRSKVKITAWPMAQQVEAYRAWCCAF